MSNLKINQVEHLFLNDGFARRDYSKFNPKAGRCARITRLRGVIPR